MAKFNPRGNWFKRHLVPVICVLVVGVGGAAYLLSSHAASPCVDGVYSYGEGYPGTTTAGDNYCIKQLQTLANVDMWRSNTNAYMAEDGEYGPITTDNITSFQKERNITADGITGMETWGWLCDLGLGGGGGGVGITKPTGFYATFDTAYNAAGCAELPAGDLGK